MSIVGNINFSEVVVSTAQIQCFYIGHFCIVVKRYRIFHTHYSYSFFEFFVSQSHMLGECRGILFRAAVRNGGGMHRRDAADRTVKHRPFVHIAGSFVLRGGSQWRLHCRRYCRRATRAAVHCKYYTKPTVYFSIDLSKFTASGSTFL